MMARATAMSAPRPTCTVHNVALDGGPVLYWCSATGHGVNAADIDNEYIPVRPVLYNAPVIAAFAWAFTASWLNFVVWMVL